MEYQNSQTNHKLLISTNGRTYLHWMHLAMEFSWPKRKQKKIVFFFRARERKIFWTNVFFCRSDNVYPMLIESNKQAINIRIWSNFSHKISIYLKKKNKGRERIASTMGFKNGWNSKLNLRPCNLFTWFKFNIKQWFVKILISKLDKWRKIYQSKCPIRPSVWETTLKIKSFLHFFFWKKKKIQNSDKKMYIWSDATIKHSSCFTYQKKTWNHKARF